MAAPELGGFRLLEPIADGGLSTVWRARHASGLTAAVKVLRLFGTPDEADRFRNEIRAVAGLSHPSIVSVLDLGHVDSDAVLPGGQQIRAGAPWLAMEYVGGGTLSPASVTSWRDFAAVTGSLLRALAHAHARRVIHRDLKPQNVLLTDARSVASGLKLTDFGIAWTRGATRERGPTGTLTYMAPEQIEVEDHHYGPWTDLYGLGCLLWEIATGAPPFDDRPGRPLAMAHLLEEPPALRARFEVPDALSAWMCRLLAKEPADRFQSAADALRALLGDEAIDDGAAITVATGPAQQDAGLRLFGLRDVPLVGRREELAVLKGALEQAAEEPVLLAFEGAEGVGRSRLLRWLHEHVEERGEAFSVLVRGTPEGRELTRSLVDRLGGAGLEGEALRAQLSWRAGLHDVDPDVRRELVDVLAPPPGRSVDRADRNHVVARWLSEVAAVRRVTFVVDDAHHAADSLEVAGHLMRDHRRPSVLVVLTFADGQIPDECAVLLAKGRTMRLGVQPRDDRLVLLRRWLRVEPQLAARLDDETGGNTLLTIELLRDHVERGWLRPGPEGLQLAPGRGVVVPQDRLAPWMSRTQRATADDEDRAVQLELAAALGEEVALAAWEAVGGEDAQPARRALLDALLSARLVESTATGFRFAHPLVRSAVLRGARAAGRFKDAHRTCLTWARVTEASPEVIAGHLVALEAWEEATVPLLDAAETRYDREGPAAAWESGRLAVQALERAGVDRGDARWSRWAILRAQLLADRGRADEGLAVLDEVDRGQLDGELRARARHVRAEILADLARVDEAWFLHLRNADDAKLPDELTVRTYDCLVTLALRQGRLDEASQWAERAERLHLRAGDEARRGVVLVHRATVAAMRRELDEAHELLDRAEPLVARYGSLKERAGLLNDRADLFRATGRYDLAEPLLARAIELYHAAGYLPIIASLNLAVCKLEQHRLDEAEAVIQQSRATSLRPETFGATGASLILAICHASRSRWAAFDRAMDRAAIGLAVHTDDDFVHLLERAADELERHGQVSRSGRCRSLARDQRDRRST